MRRQITAAVIMVFVTGVVFGCMAYAVTQNAHAKGLAAQSLPIAKPGCTYGAEVPGHALCDVCVSSKIQIGCGIPYFPIETLWER